MVLFESVMIYGRVFFHLLLGEIFKKRYCAKEIMQEESRDFPVSLGTLYYALLLCRLGLRPEFDEQAIYNEHKAIPFFHFFRVSLQITPYHAIMRCLGVSCAFLTRAGESLYLIDVVDNKGQVIGIQ